MQVFRAYTQDAAGKITWAAWIQAESHSQARSLADPLCQGQAATIDLWWSASRELAHGSALEPV